MAVETIIDLTDYKDRVGGRAEPGVYTAVIEDVEMDVTSKPDPKTGKPSQMLNVWIRIQDPNGEADGVTIIDRLVQRSNTMFRTVNMLQALGVPTPRKRFKLDFAKLVGKRLQIDVADGQPYQGRVKSEVRGYMKLSVNGASKPKAEQADLSDIDPDAAGEFAAETTQNPSPEAQAARQEPEDVPFDTSAAEPVAEPEEATEVDGPEEIDLDTIDLDDADLG
jgi:hypothetical protein